jgi:hypothetical protein
MLTLPTLLLSSAFAQSADLSHEAQPLVHEVHEVYEAQEGYEEVPEQRLYHGFRVGYTYVAGIDEDSTLQSPHLFVLGYELTQRALGGRWLDVVVIGNASVAGINQSIFIPSANGLVGFAIDKQIEIGTGVNWSPFDPSGKNIHQVIAVGWTPPAGAFNVPIHATLIPDIDGNWRLGTTVGVNW